MKVRQTMSSEVNPEGAIRMKQTQTPIAQLRLMSLEDFRRMIFMTSGMLKSGRATAAVIPTVEIIFSMISFLW